MKKSPFRKRNSAQKVSRIATALVSVGLFCVGLISAAVTLAPATASAATGINQTVNYQGRLLTAVGAVVPDGTYNMEFQIWQDGNGCLPSGTCTSANAGTNNAGTLKWTEDWVYGVNTPDNRVAVKNGYFSVSLGSICAFAATSCTAGTGNPQTNAGVNFNSDTLWLTTNIGNTSSSATFSAASGDGLMIPFKRLASNPYAINSGQLGGLTSSQFVQLGQSIQAATSTTNAAIGINQTGATANILDLQRGGADVHVINNAGQTLFRPTTDSQTALQVQKAGTTTVSFTVDSSNSRIGIGTGSPAYAVDAVGSVNASTSLKVAGTDVCTTSGCTASTTSAILNQNSSAQTSSNFWISGTGSANVFNANGTNPTIQVGGIAALENGANFLRINQSSQFVAGIWTGTSPILNSSGGVYLGSAGSISASQIALITNTTDTTRRITADGTNGNFTAAGLATINGGATITGTTSLYGATQHYNFNNVIAGTAGWFKLGTLALPEGGYNANIKLYGGAGYNAVDTQLAWEEINFRTSNGSSTNGTGFGASGEVTSYGPSSATVFSQVKIVANAAGNSATSYDVYVYSATFVGVGYYTVDLSGGSWSHSATTASDPGVNSSTIYALPYNFSVLGQLSVSTTGAAVSGLLQAATVNATSGFQANGTSGLTGVTCSGGQVLQNAAVSGGILTAGSCVAAGSGANVALSNLASVAINTSLLPATTNTIDLGSTTDIWKDLYTVNIDTQSSTNTALTIGTSNASSITIGKGGVTTAVSGGFTTPAAIGTSLFNLGGYVKDQCVGGGSICNLTLTSNGGQSIVLDNGASDEQIDLNGQTVVVGQASVPSLSVYAGGASATVPTVFIQQGATPTSTADALDIQDSSGNVNAKFGSTGAQLTLGRIAASGTVTQGKLVLSDGTTDNFGLTLQGSTLSHATTINVPYTTGTATNYIDTVCLQALSNCTGGGANVGLSNLSGVAINTSLLPGSNNAIDLGSSTFAFRTSYAATSSLAPLFDTISAGPLAIGTNTATSIALKQNTSIATGKTFTTNGSGFDGSGNLGLGTTSPGANLDVQSSTATGNIINVTGNSLTSGTVLNISQTTTSANNSISNAAINISRSITAASGSTALALDNPLNVGSNSYQTSMSYAFTVASHSNRVLFVSLENRQASAPTATVTYAGVSMTAVQNTAFSGARVYLFELLNPPVGTANVVINASTATLMGAQTSSWYNVNQTTPISNYTINSTASVALTGAVGGYIITDTYNGLGSTATTGQTVWPYDVGNSSETDGGYKAATAGTNTLSWSNGSGTPYTDGFMVNPVAVADTTITNSLINAASNCTATTGICADTSSLLSLNQQFATASGSIATLQNAGTGDMIDFLNGSSAVLSGFNSSGNLFFNNSTFKSAVSTTTLTGNQTITLPNASGSVCLDSGNCSGAGGYIVNGTGYQTGAQFNIGGTGIGGGLEVVAGSTTGFDVSSAGVLNIGTTNATTLNIANNNAGHTIALGTGTGSQLISLGSTGGSSSVSLLAGSGNVNIATASGNGIYVGNVSTAVTQNINVGNNSTAGSVDNVSVGSIIGASGTVIQGGSTNVNVTTGTTSGNILLSTNNSGAGVVAKDSTANTAAFQVQNAAGASVFNVDTSYNNISVLGNNSGHVSAWAATTSVCTGTQYGSAVAANGYMYYIAGDTAGFAASASTTVCYAPINANGTLGTWATTTALPSARAEGMAATYDGYLYYMGGTSSSFTSLTTVFSAKINSNGTVGAWTTLTSTPLAVGIDAGSAAVANGYLYIMGGETGSSSLNTIRYAKLNAGGTLGAWTTSGFTLSTNDSYSGVAVANNKIYVVGGNNNATYLNSVNVCTLSASSPDVTANCTAVANLPSARNSMGVAASNGYIYMMGGSVTGPTNINDVEYAPITASGIGSWTAETGTSLLPAATNAGQSATYNGYLYFMSGSTGSTTAVVDYASLSRVSVGGSLDLVGLQGQSLSNYNGGGSLTAGNTQVIGNLSVQGSANFNTSVNIQQDLSASGPVSFYNSTNSGAAFRVQNAAGTQVLNVSTATSTVQVRQAADIATQSAETFTSSYSFPATGGWTAISGTAQAATATHTAGGGTTALSPTPAYSTTVGVTYDVRFTLSGSITAGESVAASMGGVTGETIYGTNAGNYIEEEFTATSTANLAFTPTNNWNGTITAVSIKTIIATVASLQVLNSTGVNQLDVRVTSAALNSTYLGLGSGQLEVGGLNNVAVGNGALSTGVNTQNSVAIGVNALQNDTNGNNEVAIGSGALQNTTTPDGLTAVGYQALNGSTTGRYNVAVGYESAYHIRSGNGNTSIGYFALSSADGSTSNNTALGYQAGAAFGGGTNSTYSGNTYLGANAGNGDSGGFFASYPYINNSTALGAYAQVTQSNAIVLGSVDTPTNVGIGTTGPANLLSVAPLDYNTGTLTRTNGSAVLVGTGTTWTPSMVGDSVISPDGSFNFPIIGYTDATHVTISTNFVGTTDASPIKYRFFKPGLNATQAGTTYVQGSNNSSFSVQDSYGSAVQAVSTIDSAAAVSDLTSGLYKSSIQNGSFENGTTAGWSALGSATISADSSMSYFGNYSMKVVTTATANDGVKYALTTSTLASNTTYSIGFQVRGATSAESILTAIELGYSNTGATATSCFTDPTLPVSGWFHVWCNFTTGTTGNSPAPYVYFRQTSAIAQTFWIDTFELERISLLTNYSGTQAIAGNWTAKSGSTVTQNTSLGVDDSNSVQTVASATAGSGVQESLTLVDNTDYNLDFEVYTPGGNYSTMEAGYNNGSTNTVCTTAQTVVTTTWTEYFCSFTTPVSHSGTPYFYVDKTDTSTPTFDIDAVELTMGPRLTDNTTYTGSGSISFGGAITSPVQVEPTYNTTSALVVSNAAGQAILAVDTAQNIVRIGSGSSGDASAILLVLDSYSGSSDPSGLFNGAMYYNSSMQSFRCGINGTWRACGGGQVGISTGASANVTNTTTVTPFTNNADSGNQYTILSGDCVAGVTYTITSYGSLSTAASAGNLKFGLYSITNGFYIANTANNALTASQTNNGYESEVTLACTGSNVMNVQGIFTYGPNGGGGTTAGAASSYLMLNTGTLSAGAGNITIAFAPTFSTASTSNIMTQRTFQVVRSGP